MAQIKKIIGWREWIKLPELGVPFLKVKVDTGARTSSLHAFDLTIFRKRGSDYARFFIHTQQRKKEPSVLAEAKIAEYRHVKSSNGQRELRPVIITSIELHGETWPIELTLANRDDMGFRMLLGRESFKNKMLVDAGKSYYSIKPKKSNS